MMTSEQSFAFPAPKHRSRAEEEPDFHFNVLCSDTLESAVSAIHCLCRKRSHEEAPSSPVSESEVLPLLDSSSVSSTNASVLSTPLLCSVAVPFQDDGMVMEMQQDDLVVVEELEYGVSEPSAVPETPTVPSVPEDQCMYVPNQPPPSPVLGCVSPVLPQFQFAL